VQVRRWNSCSARPDDRPIAEQVQLEVVVTLVLRGLAVVVMRDLVRQN